MDDKEMLDYLEQMVKEKPIFEIIHNNIEGYIVRCSYITGKGETLRYAIQNYKIQRDVVIEKLTRSVENG